MQSENITNYDLGGQPQYKKEQLADIIWDKHDLSCLGEIEYQTLNYVFITV